VNWLTKPPAKASSRGSPPAPSGGCWLLEEAELRPHQSRYWLTPAPADPAVFAAQVQAVCGVYAQALTFRAQGGHLVSCDEMTGIQALERAAPILPLRPGRVERREFEYIRHGTQCLIANFDVATGQVVSPSIGFTRTEADFAAHIDRTIATDPDAAWVFVVDNLNTHQSESLVRLVIDRCGPALDSQTLGVKEKSGLLRSMATRAAFDRPHPPDPLRLHTQTLLLAQPGRDLALHPDPQTAPSRQLHLHRRSPRPHPRLHRLLQPHHGQAFRLDLLWPSAGCLS